MKRRQLLLIEMHKIIENHPDKDNYVVTGMKIALDQKGIKCSRQKVLMTMRKRNLVHKSRKNYRSYKSL